MTETYVPSKYAIGYLDGMKKDYQKMRERCTRFEQEHKGTCQRIGLDLDAFNIEKNPDHPAQEIFQLAQLTDRDRQVIGEYLSNREKMYIMEQCVRCISDDDSRWLAKMYYLKRMTQPEIAAAIGRTKSYVSKRLDKAEQGEMAEAIDGYFAWKYSVPGGKNCFWASEWEEKYMRDMDAANGILRMPTMPGMLWIKSLKRMGFM